MYRVSQAKQAKIWSKLETFRVIQHFFTLTFLRVDPVISLRHEEKRWKVRCKVHIFSEENIPCWQDSALSNRIDFSTLEQNINAELRRCRLKFKVYDIYFDMRRCLDFDLIPDAEADGSEVSGPEFDLDVNQERVSVPETSSPSEVKSNSTSETSIDKGQVLTSISSKEVKSQATSIDRGCTIGYRPIQFEKSTIDNQDATITSSARGCEAKPTDSSTSKPKVSFDALTKPVTRLTEESSFASRYMLSRLRDHELREKVRRYISFFKTHQQSYFAEESFTSLKAYIKSEGLPIEIDKVEQLYYQFMSEFCDVSEQDAQRDIKLFTHHVETDWHLRRCHSVQAIRQHYGLTGMALKEAGPSIKSMEILADNTTTCCLIV